VTIAATFLASIGFFGAVVFLPRWFQFVQGVSPTESGLQTLALLGGVIVGSVGSGILVSRTGKYKWLITGALAVMSLGLFLLTGLDAHTGLPVLWVWMFITGLGVGPTFSVFTVVIQSVVPFEKLGVATANLTFFRQIGGSVGLAIVGTIFGSAFVTRLQPELVRAGVPGEVASQISQNAGNADAFTQVGGAPLADQLAAFLPADLIPMVVEGIHQAFSLAIADSFWLGLAATLVALVLTAVALPQLALRGFEPRPSAAPAPHPGAGRPADVKLGVSE
jgi:MFS family permease